MSKLTEGQIEAIVEGKMNQLDRLFMTERLGRAEYDLAVLSLNQWADEQYSRKRA